MEDKPITIVCAVTCGSKSSGIATISAPTSTFERWTGEARRGAQRSDDFDEISFRPGESVAFLPTNTTDYEVTMDRVVKALCFMGRLGQPDQLVTDPEVVNASLQGQREKYFVWPESVPFDVYELMRRIAHQPGDRALRWVNLPGLHFAPHYLYATAELNGTLSRLETCHVTLKSIGMEKNLL